MSHDEDVRLVRREHYECEDCWYSCPASGGCCDDSRDDDRCTCGADEVNAALDRILARYGALMEEHEAWAVDPDADDEHTLAWLKVEELLHRT